MCLRLLNCSGDIEQIIFWFDARPVKARLLLKGKLIAVSRVPWWAPC